MRPVVADPCMRGRAGVRALAELINGDGQGVLNVVAGVSDILVRYCLGKFTAVQDREADVPPMAGLRSRLECANSTSGPAREKSLPDLDEPSAQPEEDSQS